LEKVQELIVSGVQLSIHGIIFDLDGTLVDTLDDLTDSMNAALAQLGRPQHTPESCRTMIGYGLRTFAEQALGPDHVGLTDELMQRMVTYYLNHCLIKTSAYEGMKETIRALSQQGIQLAVLTNKNQTPAEIISRHYFGTDVFDPVVGAADERKSKPDPTTTLDILNQWDLGKNEVLFVGDSETDVQTAINAGLRCIGCLWGFRSKEQLREAGTEILIEHPRQILNYMG
jgi:phosphoglycolate phosphatase